MSASIAILASGTGSNAAAIMDYFAKRPDSAQTAVVVSDNPKALALDKAAKRGIDAVRILPQDYGSKADYETAILQTIQARGVRFVALAGYMRLVGPTLLETLSGRIINIHPSLLPAFAGRSAVRDALTAGVRTTGITIHYIDSGVDTGPIIYQKALPILPGESEESLMQRIHELEHFAYPRVIHACVENRVYLHQKSVIWRDQLLCECWS